MSVDISDDNFVVLQGYAVKQLKLKGTELIVYSIISGFSQTNGNWFTGSVNYLCSWTNAGRTTIFEVLAKLVDKGLIEKKEIYKNGIKYCEYRALKTKTDNKPTIEEKPLTEPNKEQLEQPKPQYKSWKKNNYNNYEKTSEPVAFNPMKLYVREECPYGNAWKEPDEEERKKIDDVLKNIKKNAPWRK